MAWSLRLVEHDLAPGERLALPAGLRVLFAAAGAAVVTSSAGPGRVDGQAAWHGAAPCALQAEAQTRLLRFELVSHPPPALGGGAARLEHPLALDAGGPWLMRCDRVDFAPGGVALPHRHRGGGIRRLLRGGLTVTVGEMAPRSMRSGDSWFESGREPVLAEAGAGEETSFVRVSVLPAEIRGRSSILYVDPADAERGRPRAYTVFVDAPIELRPARA